MSLPRTDASIRLITGCSIRIERPHQSASVLGGRSVRRRQQASLPEQMAPLIDLASRHIVAPRDARQRLFVHSHSGDDLELLRVAPPTTPFPAQYLHRSPSLWLRTSITTSLWTSLTRSHHSKAGDLNRPVTFHTPSRPYDGHKAGADLNKTGIARRATKSLMASILRVGADSVALADMICKTRYRHI